MKWILLFLALLLPSWMYAQEEQVPEPIISIAEFVENTKLQIISAQKASPEELYAQPLSWTTALYADEKSISPVTGAEGAGPWVQTPFGRIRLLSCQTGISEANQLWLTLDTEIKNGWSVHLPFLSVRPTPLIKKARFFIPKLPPFDGQTPKQFVRSASFPLYLELNQAQKPLEVIVDTNFEACFQNDCRIIETPVLLTLPAAESHPSPYCAYIRRSLMYVPAQASDEQMLLYLTPEGQLQIEVHFDNSVTEPQVLLTQQHQIFYQLIDKKINQNQAVITVLPENWISSEPVTVTVLNGREIMEKTMIPQPGTAPIPQAVSFPAPEKAGMFLLFFLTTPLMAYLLHVSFKNEYAARRKSLFIAGCYLSFGCFFQLFFDQLQDGHFYDSMFWAWAMGMIFVASAIWFHRLTFFSFIALTCVAPLTYLYPLTQQADGWLFMELACVAALPYLLFAYAPSLAVSWSRLTCQFPVFWKRLVLLFNAVLWTGILLCLVYHAAVPDKTNPLEAKAQITLISPPWHIKGTLFDITATQLSTGKELRKQGLLAVRRLTPQKAVLSEEHPLFPFAVLTGDKLSRPLLIKPTLSTYQLTDYFKAAFD